MHTSLSPTSVSVCVCVCVFSYVWLFATPWTVACQAPLSMEFSRHEYWSGLPFPSSGDLPDPGLEPVSLAFLSLAGRFFTTAPLRSPRIWEYDILLGWPKVRSDFPARSHRKTWMYFLVNPIQDKGDFADVIKNFKVGRLSGIVQVGWMWSQGFTWGKERQGSQSQKGEVMTEVESGKKVKKEKKRRRKKGRRKEKRKGNEREGRRRRVGWGRGRERCNTKSTLLALKTEERFHESRNAGRF